MGDDDAPDMAGSAEAWSKAAKGYQETGSMRTAAGLKAADLRPGETVLDVGTGPGLTFCSEPDDARRAH